MAHMQNHLFLYRRQMDCENMKRIREQLGITYKGLSHFVYESRRQPDTDQIQAIEEGRSIPQYKTLLRIAKHLQCSVDDIAPKIEGFTPPVVTSANKGSGCKKPRKSKLN